MLWMSNKRSMENLGNPQVMQMFQYLEGCHCTCLADAEFCLGREKGKTDRGTSANALSQQVHGVD